MQQIIKQEKHEIALLTENELYIRIKSLNEERGIDYKKREEIKQKMIDVFVEYCTKKYKTLTPQQIRKHVMLILNRTIKNIRRIKQMREEER